METKNIIQSSSLSIGYKTSKAQTIVASDINIALRTSQITALVGVNGAGKSTLLRTLGGLQELISGNISIGGKEMSTLSRRDIAQQMSLVLTEKLPDSNLSVFELVATARQPYTNWIGSMSADDLEKVNESLRLTQTETLAAKKIHEISDGQLQKVMVARALAQDTPIIILDEPTTHLDLQHKISLLKLLKELAHHHQKCIFFSTHDIELAIQISDSIIVMNENQVIQETPANLISSGLFSRLFNDSNIMFDAEKVKFIFKDI